jgi:hypothetical protein
LITFAHQLNQDPPSSKSVCKLKPKFVFWFFVFFVFSDFFYHFLFFFIFFIFLFLKINGFFTKQIVIALPINMICLKFPQIIDLYHDITQFLPSNSNLLLQFLRFISLEKDLSCPTRNPHEVIKQLWFPL